MNLYEVTNDHTANSYVRAYVWAANESDALKLAYEAFRAHMNGYNEQSWLQIKCKRLFQDTDAPFCTIPDGDGWESMFIRHSA